jgi:hypothetical protein
MVFVLAAKSPFNQRLSRQRSIWTLQTCTGLLLTCPVCLQHCMLWNALLECNIKHVVTKVRYMLLHTMYSVPYSVSAITVIGYRCTSSCFLIIWGSDQVIISTTPPSTARPHMLHCERLKALLALSMARCSLEPDSWVPASNGSLPVGTNKYNQL